MRQIIARYPLNVSVALPSSSVLAATFELPDEFQPTL